MHKTVFVQDNVENETVGLGPAINSNRLFVTDQNAAIPN